MYECQVEDSLMERFIEKLECSAYEKAIPLKGTFELTARCNFDCNMCYVHLKEEQINKIGRELSNEEWIDIAQQAKDAGMLSLTLTGGEVFGRSGFKELYEHLSEMGFLINILSNGYFIDEKTITWLKKRPPHFFRLTLYGASNETYERVCGVKNGFDRVVQAIDLLQKAGIPLLMVSTIVKENEKDVEAMYQFAKEKRIPYRASCAIVKPVRGAERNVEEHKIDIVNTLVKQLIKKETINIPYTKANNILDYCGKYKNGFVITWNGDLQLCSFMNKPKISLLKYDFRNAWNLLIDCLAKITEPEECVTCKYKVFCNRCPGILSAECGSYEYVTQEFCDRAKMLYEKMKEEVAVYEKEICRTTD